MFDPNEKVTLDTDSLIFERSRAAMVSLMGAQERYLQDVVRTLGISEEEFIENYELEYKTIETEYDTLGDTISVRFRQEFRVKLKEKN